MPQTNLELLDEVLHFLTHTTTWEDLRQKYPDTKIDKEKVRVIIRKLVRDGYVDRFSGEKKIILPEDEVGYLNATKIQRNFEGDLFVEQGGYKTQKLNNDNKNNRLEKLEKQQRRNSMWTLVLTIILTLGTVAQALYSVMLLHKDFHWFPLIHP